MADASGSAQLETRLRQALAGTNEDLPRPLASLDLPLKAERLLLPTLLKNLRPAAVLAPVIRRGDVLNMLLTRRTETLRAHKGQISFPGGRRDETDASAADNALREAQEEIGLDPRHVEVIGYLDDYPTGTGFRVTPVVGVVHGQDQFRGDPGEVAEIFEVPLSLLLEPASYERKILSREGLNLPFFEVNYGAYRIWGATAGMLWNLCQKVVNA
jgi:8-oxo-dGTP pyrophosphatase MutT (NUDIX family)